MCGRFGLWAGIPAIKERFGIDATVEISPRYNIAPGQPACAIRENRTGKRIMDFMLWGFLLPSHVSGSGELLVNARAETVFVRSLFRFPVRFRRCLVPASGFYEWRASYGKKVPYLVRLKNGDFFAMAGIWERPRRGNAGRVVDGARFLLLTCVAEGEVARVHHRMPVVLSSDAWEMWLDREITSASRIASILRMRLSSDAWDITRIGTGINNPQSEGPQLIAPRGSFGDSGVQSFINGFEQDKPS